MVKDDLIKDDLDKIPRAQIMDKYLADLDDTATSKTGAGRTNKRKLFTCNATKPGRFVGIKEEDIESVLGFWYSRR